MLGKRYIVVDAVKRSTTSQSTSFSQREDDSTIWVMPEKSKDISDRIEVRSRKDVYDNKTRKIVIRDVRTPKKVRKDLTVGRTFTVKNKSKDKGGVLFKLTKVTENSAELEYSANGGVRQIKLDLVKSGSNLYERFAKAYVETDNSKLNNSNQPVEMPDERIKPPRRSRRR